MNIFLSFLASYCYIFCVFVLSIIMQKLNIVKDEGARKIIHIAVCFTWIIMEVLFKNSICKIIIPFSFIIVNWISLKKHIIPGMDRKENDSFGTVYYALSLTLMNTIALFNNEFVIPAGIGIFTLSFGDGFASLFGKIRSKYNYRFKNGKSLFGSLACFIFTIIGLIILNYIMNYNIVPIWMVVISFFATILELIGGKYDNLLVPFGTYILSFLLVN